MTNATNIVGVCEAIGGRIASCGWDGTARSGRRRRRSRRQAQRAAAGARARPRVLPSCAPDGRVATGAGDGIVRLWKMPDTGGGYALEAAGASSAARSAALPRCPAPGGGGRPGGQRRRGPRPPHGRRGYDAVLSVERASPSTRSYLLCVGAADGGVSGTAYEIYSGGDDGVPECGGRARRRARSSRIFGEYAGRAYGLCVLPDASGVVVAADEAGTIVLSRAPSRAAPRATAAASAAAQAMAAASEAANGGGGGGGGAGGGGGGGTEIDGVRYDFCFPVEIAQGVPAEQQPQIYWNRGDNLEEVAYGFVMRNARLGLRGDEIPQIIDFIKQASGQGGGGGRRRRRRRRRWRRRRWRWRRPRRPIRSPRLCSRWWGWASNPTPPWRRSSGQGWSVEVAVATLLG